MPIHIMHRVSECEPAERMSENLRVVDIGGKGHVYKAGMALPLYDHCFISQQKAVFRVSDTYVGDVYGKS